MLTTTRPFSATLDALGVGATALDALIDALPVAVLVVDRAGVAMYANAAARALPLDDVRALRWAITHALLTEDAVRGQALDARAADGSRLALSADVWPVREASAAPHAALVVVADVTARDRLAAWAPVMESLARL